MLASILTPKSVRLEAIAAPLRLVFFMFGSQQPNAVNHRSGSNISHTAADQIPVIAQRDLYPTSRRMRRIRALPPSCSHLDKGSDRMFEQMGLHRFKAHIFLGWRGKCSDSRWRGLSSRRHMVTAGTWVVGDLIVWVALISQWTTMLPELNHLCWELLGILQRLRRACLCIYDTCVSVFMWIGDNTPR